jgi:hypothetical protein
LTFCLSNVTAAGKEPLFRNQDQPALRPVAMMRSAFATIKESLASASHAIAVLGSHGPPWEPILGFESGTPYGPVCVSNEEFYSSEQGWLRTGARHAIGAWLQPVRTAVSRHEFIAAKLKRYPPAQTGSRAMKDRGKRPAPREWFSYRMGTLNGGNLASKHSGFFPTDS